MKILYKPFGIVASVLGGMLAGAIFKRVWKLAAHEDEAPEATDAQRGWGEVLIAATLQGAIFALVKAATDRGSATIDPPAPRLLAGQRGRRRGIAAEE